MERWYKITATDSFTEISRIGEKYIVENIEAKQYPEKLRIQDMLNCYEDRWTEIEKDIVEQLLVKANSTQP